MRGRCAHGVHAPRLANPAAASLAIVEVMLGHADDLVVLVPFSGDEQDVAGDRHGRRERDGRAAIDDATIAASRGTHGPPPHLRLRERARASRLEPRDDHVDDGVGHLGPWVVGGHDREVCGAARRLTHERPLAVVPVAAAPEDDDEPPARQRLGGLDDPGERVGRVRVVDDTEDPALIDDALGAARPRRSRARAPPRSPRREGPPRRRCRPLGRRSRG